MFSIWEKKHFIYHDFIVIGSGITGLSTACSIKENKPNSSVLVLERGIFPTGASTKNAGFACIGSFTEKLSDLKLMGEETFLRLIENRWNGLIKLRKRLGDEHIDYINHGGYELIFHKQEIAEDDIQLVNGLLQKVFKKNIFYHHPELINAFGINPGFVKDILVNPMEGQIDTGKMMMSLFRYAGLLQAKVVTGAEVLGFNEINDGVEVVVKNPAGTEPVVFRTRQVAVCTNAFTQSLLPEIEMMPGRGQVICTSPIPNLKLKGIYSFDEGYYYFRNFENRVILGGGRNLDFATEATTSFDLNEQIINQLEFYLEEMIVPGEKYEIEHKWTGIMAFGKDKLPVVKRVSDYIAVGARLNGMGIALGSKIGEDLANILIRG